MSEYGSGSDIGSASSTSGGYQSAADRARLAASPVDGRYRYEEHATIPAVGGIPGTVFRGGSTTQLLVERHVLTLDVEGAAATMRATGQSEFSWGGPWEWTASLTRQPDGSWTGPLAPPAPVWGFDRIRIVAQRHSTAALRALQVTLGDRPAPMRMTWDPA